MAGQETASVDPDWRIPMLIEFNVRFPGGLVAICEAFHDLWDGYSARPGIHGRKRPQPALSSRMLPRDLCSPRPTVTGASFPARMRAAWLIRTSDWPGRPSVSQPSSGCG